MSRRSAIGLAACAGLGLLPLAATPAAAPAGTSSYMNIAGVAFRAGSHATVLVSHPGNCISTGNAPIHADFFLPQGAVLQGVRAYGHNDGIDPGAGVQIAINAYDGAGQSLLLLDGVTRWPQGYASEPFPITPGVVIDNQTHAYSLLARVPDGQQLCSVRILYVAP